MPFNNQCLFVGASLTFDVGFGCFMLMLSVQIQGRLEGGQLYTPAYVTRVNAMVRGAARGITVPMNLSALWSSLQQLLQAMDGATGVAMDNSFFQSLFNSLVKEAEILGSLRAGVHWTPAVGINLPILLSISVLPIFSRVDSCS